MDAEALSARDLFDGKVCYEVPAFQRPYVWTEEDQWSPLWDDIQRLVEPLLDLGEEDRRSQVSGHFLGAVVLKQLQSTPWNPRRSSIIDGQQRLTTLQLVLDAVQLVAAERGTSDDAESLLELVLNDSDRFRGTPNRFKLRPSRIDRPAFEQVMDSASVRALTDENRIVQAHDFFRNAVSTWAGPNHDEVSSRRLTVLAEILQDRLQVVAITLSVDDDDQLIFETLNDRGTPLLAADLIKNYIFQQCEELGGDVDEWSDTYWLDFDADWWRGEVAQGRLFRSRIDLFLQYWLTMRTRTEVSSSAVFSLFREYAKEYLQTSASAEAFLSDLRADADTFRDFAELDPTTPRGRFYSRVVEALELGAFTPLLLWLISDNHATPPDQADRALAALESWAVRRTLARRTMKDLNNFVIALLRELDTHAPHQVGDATAAFLLDQTADAREWPTDDQLREVLPETRAYGSIKQQRLRTILAAVEMRLRTDRHEGLPLPFRLDIEHVMPQGWRPYWGNGFIEGSESTLRRDRLVNTLGNLTLATQKLNVALSNRPWTDSEAAIVAPTGKDAGKGKRSLIDGFSILELNKEIVAHHTEAWTERDILERSKKLTEIIIAVWPRG